jgi:hypothetical protein
MGLVGLLRAHGVVLLDMAGDWVTESLCTCRLVGCWN